MQAVDRQDHVALVGEPLREVRRVGEPPGKEFLIARQQIGDRALRDGNALRA